MSRPGLPRCLNQYRVATNVQNGETLCMAKISRFRALGDLESHD